jgi:hypothetical protein
MICSDIEDVDANGRRGSILTASEMEALTEGWKPYRSLGEYE